MRYDLSGLKVGECLRAVLEGLLVHTPPGTNTLLQPCAALLYCVAWVFVVCTTLC